VIGRLALALGGFGLCLVAVLMPMNDGSMTGTLVDAMVRRATEAGVRLMGLGPGETLEPYLAASAVLALGLSRPLVVSRLASLAYFAGAALAFWLFPLVVGAFEHDWFVNSAYFERASAAMLSCGLLAELIVHCTRGGVRIGSGRLQLSNESSSD
jgi:hypothetical protein